MSCSPSCDPFDILQQREYARCEKCGLEWVLDKVGPGSRWIEKPVDD